MRTVIAFTGLKTSGKTTAFDMVKQIYPDAIEITLAKKLKDESARVFNIPRNHFDDQEFKEVPFETPVYVEAHHVYNLIQSYGFAKEEIDFDTLVRPHIGQVLDSPRRVAQYVGTEILRNVDTDIHCKGATMGLSEEGLFVVTDMRFPSELEYFRDKFDCDFNPFYIQSYRAEAAAGGDMHPSERQVLVTAKSCTLLENNKTIREFQDKVAETVQEVVNGSDIAV